MTDLITSEGKSGFKSQITNIEKLSRGNRSNNICFINMNLVFILRV